MKVAFSISKRPKESVFIPGIRKRNTPSRVKERTTVERVSNSMRFYIRVRRREGEGERDIKRARC